MKKFVSKHWIILVSLVVAIAIVFFYCPFILTNSAPASNGGEVNPCPGPDAGQFGNLCNLVFSVTLYGYLQNPEPGVSINWEMLIISFVPAFLVIYVDIKLIRLVIKLQVKKYKLLLLLSKVLAILVIMYIPFFIMNYILSFFGLS